MKTVIRFLLVVMYMTLMIACNETDQLINVSQEIDLKSAPIECQVITVLPNGYDDTEALKQAFDDALPGSVVQLGEGTFHLGFMEIREFSGTFMGAGKGKTIITAKTGLDCEVIKNQGLSYYLISFIGGDIFMSDITLKAPAESICANTSTSFDGLLLFGDYNKIYTSENNYIKATVNNIEFIGYNYNPMKYRALNAIVASQSGINLSGITRSNIDLTVTNCTFDAFFYGAQMRGVKEGKCTIGSKNNGNIISNCLESVWLSDVINIPVEVVDNRFNVSIGCYGLDFENSPIKYYVVETQMKCPVIDVERNEFNISGPTGIRIM